MARLREALLRIRVAASRWRSLVRDEDHDEWYEKHMYGNAGIRKWHLDTFGPDSGYKELIPKFTPLRETCLRL